MAETCLKQQISQDMLNKLLPHENPIVVPSIEPIGSKPIYSFIKRFFDICVSMVALLMCSIPAMVIAIIIRLDSPGPIIYKQSRLGKNGHIFKIYKFRSMRTDAEEAGAQWATDEDPRITRFGQLMRKSRLDEIPQFVNVLKGEMSLIGPRPERPEFAERFEEKIIGFRQRTLVKPGISGLAQIKGGYDLLPSEKIVYDLEYIQKRSVLLDVSIMIKTLQVVYSHDGAR